VFSSTISCAEVADLVRAVVNLGQTVSDNPQWNWGTSFVVNGFVCIKEPAPGDSGGFNYQCISGSRVVSFFAV